MTELSDQCKEHLEAALQEDDSSEKDFYIHQVLQACGGGELPNKLEAQ